MPSPENVEAPTTEHHEFEMQEEWDPAVPYVSDPEMMRAMQTRILHMEDALLRVMRHLEDQSAPSSQSTLPTQHE